MLCVSHVIARSPKVTQTVDAVDPVEASVTAVKDVLKLGSQQEVSHLSFVYSMTLVCKLEKKHFVDASQTIFS